MGESDVTGPSQPSAAAEWRASWTLVLAATVGYSISSIPAGSTGVMMGPIEAEFGWSRTEIYSGVALISFIGVLLATFIGAGIDRFGARPIGIAAGAAMSAAIAALALVGESLWQWWALWALVGLASAAMPTVWLTPVAGRFTASRGLAVAIVLSGSGLATFAVPIISHALVEAYGWRGAYMGLGMIWAVLTLPLLLLFFHGGGNPSSGKRTGAAATAPAELPGFTVSQGFRSVNFYKLLLAAFFGIFGGVALIMNLVPVLISTGIPRGSAATVSGLIGIATITGRIAGGWLLDRMSAKLIAALSTSLAAVLPVILLLFPGSAALAAIAIIIYGLVGGAKIGATAYLASRHLGQRAFGTLYGTINASIAFAVGTAPLAANFIYDLTGSYEIVMWAAAPILLLGGAIYASLGTYPDFAPKERSAG